MEHDILNLHVDDGLLRLNVNDNGLLCFNPSDFSLYNRFLALAQELPEIEARYIGEHGEDESDAVEGSAEKAKKQFDCADEIDREMKSRLNAVFGNGADFHKLLGGVNCLAYGGNGEMIIANLLNAIKPYLETGVKQHAQRAAERAKLNREQRRAALEKPEEK